MHHFSKESERKKNKHFILNALDEAEDCCCALCVKPLDHVLDFSCWIYAGSLSSPLTNFIWLQNMFLCHKTEHPDELSFQKKNHTNS